MSPDSHSEEKRGLVPRHNDPAPHDLTDSDYVVEPLPDATESRWLQDRLDVLQRHFFLIGLAVLVVAALVTYTVRQTVPLYRATATVRFNDARSNLTSGVGSNVPGQVSWTVDPIKSQIELFASRATAEQAVDQGKLQLREVTFRGSLDWLSGITASDVTRQDTLRLRFTDSTVSASLGRSIANAPYSTPLKLPDLTFTIAARPTADSAVFVVSPKEDVISAVQGGLRGVRRVDTDIADLSYTGTDPYFAQRALNASTTALQDLSMRSSQQTARARRQFLDQQLRKTDSVLEVKRGQLSAFRSSTQTFSSKDRITAEQSSLASVKVRREELRADRDVYASLLARAEAARQTGSTNALRTLVSAPGVSANPAIMEAYQQLVLLKNARDSLTAGPFPAAATNPDVVRLNALMQSAGEQLVTAVKSQIESFDARIAALDALATRSVAAGSALPQTEAEEARLMQEEEGTQRIAEQLREEQQRASISEVAQGGQVQIIDMARQPGSPINTVQTRKILLATLLAFILAIELALLLDSLDKTFRKTVEVENMLKLPTLGAVPELPNLGHHHKGNIPRLPSVKFLSHSKALERNGSSSAVLDYSAPAFESFRALRTSLMFSNAVQRLRSIIVTSAAPGDGKSTTAANLAAAFAQQGMRVIAIDCDIRVGRLNKLFGLPGSPGLMEVVLGEVALADAIQTTHVQNLFLLSAGRNPPNATELLGSDVIRAILGQLNAEFDLLVIDTPPVLATADAAVLGSMVDGVIVVIRIGVTDRAAAKRAVDRMRATGARVVGTVLNDPDEVLGSREDYYQYHYGYSTGAPTR